MEDDWGRGKHYGIQKQKCISLLAFDKNNQIDLYMYVYIFISFLVNFKYSLELYIFSI